MPRIAAKLGPDTAKFGAVVAYVSGSNGFGEYFSRRVGAEDAYLLFDRLSRLAAFTHRRLWLPL